ncbi:MAG TPA: 3-phosphoshikimate 1-carboxyvinyltransferase [Polyangiaceae bacterium]|nr:3-phosphoshikimate 1-carboxyvinyltransferase [Polyangiaceae bacterium]
MFPRGPLVIPVLPAPPHVVWPVPGSKSITNRALVLAALADGQTRLEGVLHSDDTLHMRRALEALGVSVRDEGPTTWVVEGGRARLRAPKQPLFVGNSGTTVRFLTALACLVPGEVELVGDAAMARRPIQDLVDGLRGLGADIECATGCPPLRVRGGRLPGGVARMRGDRSSQYFSALIMAAGLADGDVELAIEGSLVSRPYVEITRRMVRDFGGDVAVTPGGFHVRAVGAYNGREYRIEPDASSASYAFALAAATGGTVEVPGLGADALQGDTAFVDVLARLGAEVEKGATSTRVRGTGRLTGIEVDMHDISDTVMTLAAIAPLATGTTRIVNVANIRIKETDRLAATVAELERLGQAVEHGADWLAVTPRAVNPATVRSYGDHRMAMSFAVLGAARAGISIEEPAVVAKTYPAFWQDFGRIYQAVGAPAPF